MKKLKLLLSALFVLGITSCAEETNTYNTSKDDAVETAVTQTSSKQSKHDNLVRRSLQHRYQQPRLYRR